MIFSCVCFFRFKKSNLLSRMHLIALSLKGKYTGEDVTTIRPDLSPGGKIGVRRDASVWIKRKSSINTVSQDAPTRSARFIYGSTATHDGSATIRHGGATNAHDASTIR